jgi:hypothetical protein
VDISAILSQKGFSNYSIRNSHPSRISLSRYQLEMLRSVEHYHWTQPQLSILPVHS